MLPVVGLCVNGQLQILQLNATAAEEAGVIGGFFFGVIDGVIGSVIGGVISGVIN